MRSPAKSSGDSAIPVSDAVRRFPVFVSMASLFKSGLKTKVKKNLGSKLCP
jgi:hypothetical protein